MKKSEIEFEAKLDQSVPKKKKAKKYNLVRVGKFAIDVVLADLPARCEVIDGEISESVYRKFVNRKGKTFNVNMNTKKYRLFKEKGVVCASCGLKGKFFALEAHDKDAERGIFHFNLYGIDADGDEVLLTKNHIFPKLIEGTNTIDNYQTMCYVCNCSKANSF
jgi:hypothetical protein